MISCFMAKYRRRGVMEMNAFELIVSPFFRIFFSENRDTLFVEVSFLFGFSLSVLLLGSSRTIPSSS